MGLCSSIMIATLVVLVAFLCIDIGGAITIDIITSSHFIKDHEAIFSSGNTFKLGFFSPVNTTNRYVGIWYNKISVTTPIWVANRNKPLRDSSGIMRVSEDGNLVVLNGQNELLWSSDVSNGVQNSSAKLAEDGNLVLRDSTTGNMIWESFQQPSNIFVENMEISSNERTGEKILVTSWKSPSDPSAGTFSHGIQNSENIPQLFIWNGSRPYWRSGPWNGRVFMGITRTSSTYLGGFTLSGDINGLVSLNFNLSNGPLLLNYVLSSTGELSENIWSNETKSWGGDWKIPETECDVYGKCGVFGVCNASNFPICSCLRGFEPKNSEEWTRGNWSGGCVRRKSLQCRVKNGGEGEVGKEDVFLKLQGMKVPDLVHWSPSIEQGCEQDCFNNCSCVAYLYVTDLGCMKWTRNLVDLQKLSSGGTHLYIRLAYSELYNNRNMKVIISTTVSAGAIILLICAISMWRWTGKHSCKKLKSSLHSQFHREENQVAVILNSERRTKRKENHPTLSDVNKLIDNMGSVKFQELPIFSLQKLATATENYNTMNKLGQGGFGPVYKGKLPDGQVIAVKRLSRASGQGLEEFVNEVVVISKLQHRNLVRLLGCSVEGEEKMLVYEYMPNKSLDAFLFDPSKKELLHWRKRSHIIEGICRGLLYLHRDSRLRIIHRDLKASNILLDQELNPKISDFGMARIFCGDEVQANTRRVVGTYGYMSPEYAMQGRFSEKSDVFSFGVLLLEIVSGKRNTSFHENEQDFHLLGHAWRLWKEGNAAALVDRVLTDPIYQVEIFRCIHVGLLCVQEFAKDRPAVATVISMLNSEIVDLPNPKQPAFSDSQINLDSDPSRQSQKKCSVNTMTITIIDGR